MNVRAMVESFSRPRTEAAGYKHHFRISAADLYPPMIEEITSLIDQGGDKAREILRGEKLDKSPIFSQYLPRAMRLPAVAWQIALEPPDDLSPDMRKIREEALDIARVWFIELTHLSVHNEPMVFHTTKDPENRFRP